MPNPLDQGGEPEACMRILVTQFRVQNHVKMKLHNNQVFKVGCNTPPSLIVR